MNYQWYRSDIDEVWIYKLRNLFYSINEGIFRYIGRELVMPNFAINYDLNYRLGEWHRDKRVIVFSGNLLRNYEWNAVEYVLRHEMAHMIVDEIFCIKGESHGEAWKKACGVVNIPEDARVEREYLKGFKGVEVSPIVLKIQKLLIHGNDDRGCSKEESEIFLAKAQELMVKYNVEMKDITGGSDRFYIKRPVGPLISRHKGWLGTVANFVAKHYNVCAIWTYCNNKRRIEFFGDPGNLDIAEYIFHALLVQSEMIWERYRKEHQDRIRSDKGYRATIGEGYNGKMYRRISKNAFMMGLIDGYRAKLDNSREELLKKMSIEASAVIVANDAILREAFEKEYNPHTTGGSRVRGRGYNDGHKMGGSLTLAQGVTGGNMKGKLLTV